MEDIELEDLNAQVVPCGAGDKALLIPVVVIIIRIVRRSRRSRDDTLY